MNTINRETKVLLLSYADKLDGIRPLRKRAREESPPIIPDDYEDDPYDEREEDMRIGKKRVFILLSPSVILVFEKSHPSINQSISLSLCPSIIHPSINQSLSLCLSLKSHPSINLSVRLLTYLPFTSWMTSSMRCRSVGYQSINLCSPSLTVKEKILPPLSSVELCTGFF